MAYYNPNGYQQQYLNTTATGSPYYGMPSMPDYNPGYNPQTMSLYNMSEPGYGGIDTTTGKQAADLFTQQAERTGPSSWANLASASANQNTKLAQSQAAAQGAGQTAQAQAALASSGGLDSGARERLQRSGMKNAMDSQQKLAGQNLQNQSQIGMNDEQNRISQLGQAASVQNTANQGQFQQQNALNSLRSTDVMHQIGETQNQNLFNMNAYNQQMQAWAGQQQANATANSGKK